MTEHTQDTGQSVHHKEPTPQHEEHPPQHKRHSLPVTYQRTTTVSGQNGGESHAYAHDVAHSATQGRSGPSPHDTGQGIAATPEHGSGDVAEPLTVGELTPATDYSTAADLDGGDP